MCVITICKNKRELPDNLKEMAIDNPDGTGVIWFDKEGMPTYKKGLTIKEVIELNKVLPFPYAFHFRITTVGKNKLLTHPYEVTPESELRMEGQAETLLMHNGHWNNWDDSVLDHAICTGRDCPKGDWSDSRAMAFLGGSIGTNMLAMLTGQKIALFKKGRSIQILGNNWELADKGIIYSNKNWEPRGYTYGPEWSTKGEFKYHTEHGYWQDSVFHPNEEKEEKKGVITRQEDKQPPLEWDVDKKEWVEIKKEVAKMKEESTKTK